MHIWLGLMVILPAPPHIHTHTPLVRNINIMSLAKAITESQAAGMSFGSSFLLPPAMVTEQAN